MDIKQPSKATLSVNESSVIAGDAETTTPETMDYR